MAGRTDLEALVYQMSTDIRQLERQNTRALAVVNGTSNKIEARYKALGRIDMGKFLDRTFDRSRLAVFEAGAARVPIFGGALEALGGAGMIAAAGLAAVAVAGTQAVQAMAFADEIDDAAQKLMIGTDALQEYRFAMTEVGGEAKDADSAIESFNKTLGTAQSGLSPKAMKGFAALGFTKAQLQSYSSGEELLSEVARRIADLSKESEQAAVAEKLGLGAMLPLLREGAAGMEALRQKARDMGIVMDAELVAKGAQANQEFETMARVIDVELKSAFVGLSDEVVGFTRHLADALKALNDFLGKYNEHNAKVGTMFPGLDEAVSRRDGFGALGILGRGFITGDAERRRRSYNAGARNVDADGIARLMERPTPAGTETLNAPPARGGGSRGRDTAEQRERRQEQFERQLARVQMEILRAWDAEFESIEGDAGNKMFVLNAEHAARLKEITDAQAEYVKSNGLRGLSEAEADQLRAAQEQVRAYEEHTILWRERRALEDYRFEIEQDAVRAAIDLLDLQGQTAVTARQRFEVEQRILALTLQSERAEQKRALAADPNIDDVERARRLAEGDRGRQGRYDAQARSSDGAQQARAIAGEILSPMDAVQAHADAYAEIDRLRQADVLSEEQAARAKAQTDIAYQEQRLAGTRSLLDGLAGLQNSSVKELAAIGKAAAITQATMDGYLAIQKAWASAPFPFNLPAVAVTTAVTGANIAAIAGLKDGGMVRGPGGPRDDKVLLWGSDGEFMSNAASVRKNRPVLEAMNRGADWRDLARSASDASGLLSATRAVAASGDAARGARYAGAGDTITFAPVIDARGADVGAVQRIESALAEHSKTFADRVNDVLAARNFYRLGTRRP